MSSRSRRFLVRIDLRNLDPFLVGRAAMAASDVLTALESRMREDLYHMIRSSPALDGVADYTVDRLGAGDS